MIITNTQIGTRIGLIHYLSPILIIILYITLINVNRNLIEAARELGATRLQAFWRVIVPLSRLGLIFAFGFGVIVSFGDVLSGLLVGGGIGQSWLGSYPLYSNMIMADYNSYTNLPRTAALATVMVLIMVVMLVVAYRMADRARATDVVTMDRLDLLSPRERLSPRGPGLSPSRLHLPAAADRLPDPLLVPEERLLLAPPPGLVRAVVRQAGGGRRPLRRATEQPQGLADRGDRGLGHRLPRGLCAQPVRLSRPDPDRRRS